MTIKPDKPINGRGLPVFGNLAGSFASVLSAAGARVGVGVGACGGAAAATGGGGGAGSGEGAARDAFGSAIDLAVRTGSGGACPDTSVLDAISVLGSSTIF